VGIQAAPAVQAVPGSTEAAGGVMGSPLWMLVPWVLFAVAAGIKFWRLTTLFRKHLLVVPSRTERLRQMLERIWTQEQQAGDGGR
jgi:hypothetical protein